MALIVVRLDQCKSGEGIKWWVRCRDKTGGKVHVVRPGFDCSSDGGCVVYVRIRGIVMDERLDV